MITGELHIGTRVTCMPLERPYPLQPICRGIYRGLRS